jgi:chorismate mutase
MTDDQLEQLKERLPGQPVQAEQIPETPAPGERVPDDGLPRGAGSSGTVPDDRVPAERLAGQLEGRDEGRWEEPVMERLVALRGATTVDADTSDAVMSRTSELLSTLLERNGVGHDQLVSIIFTSTKDLRSAFPALAARELGLGDVPLLCAGELDVIGGNPNTIRVLVHCYSTVPRASLRHVYLHAAKHLRDDLPE